MIPVFFYGLFMDKKLLREKELRPTEPVLAYAEGYKLNIGERATLTKSADKRAYGAVMALSKIELDSLYGESSVADYVPEEIIVTDFNNESQKVIVYNLPLEKLVGRNKEYAGQLAKTAMQLGLPTTYIQEIETFAN